MMPILKKSKEMAKHLRENNIKPNFRRPSNPSFSSHRSNGMPPSLRGGGRGSLNHHMRGGHRKIFIKGRGGRSNGPPMGIGRKPMLNRMIPNRNPLQRFGGSTTAAAEAYVADYMRTMQYQLPPMPMNPPFGSLPPTLPRYYDGVPTIPDYPPPPIASRNPAAAASSNYDKRSYDEFMWKNKNRNPNGGGGGPSISNNRDRSRDSRDTYRSGGDKHRNNYRR